MSHIREFEHLKITLEAIKSATNNFAPENCIGRGGFGNVYKGEIVHSRGRSMVAFKRLDCAFGQGNPEFWKEITMLSIYKHTILVCLLGFCDESDEKILVYEYASKRSLDLHLDSNDLTWTQRLKICIGVARGLSYLHNSETNVRVLHRDIKSSNILLDENWNAKLSDFGLSKFARADKFTFLFTCAVGTLGYCDPLYAETGFLTKESDIYSLGVVLFEVLCGRLCIDKKDGRPLIGLARHCYELNKVDSIIFSSMVDEINPNSLRAFTTIAYQCLKIDREKRPSIIDVVRMLETALKYQVTVHKLEQESAFFFNMKYFEEQVQAGEWDEVEKYLCGFTKVEDNRYSMKIFFEIRKQKYLEALDRNDRAKAVEILVKDLKVFSTFNEELFKEITQLLTLDNFRQNEQLSKYGDTKSARSIMLVELKKLIEANPLFREKLTLPVFKASRLRTLINQSLNWQHQLCKNPRPNPDIKTLFIDHTCASNNGGRAPPPINSPLSGPVPKAGVFPPIGAHGPFQPVVSPSAGWMATANLSMPHAGVAAGPPGLVGQPPVTAAFLKHPRTPPGAPGLEYQMADSEHLMKRARVGPSDEVSFSGSTHPPNAYSLDDLPKTVVRLLNQGSNVMSLDFHPQQQTILLAGTNVGEISIWEVGTRERMVHKPFKVWDLSACSMPFQTTLVKDAAVSVNRCIWGPDGSILGVAFSKHIVQIYTYNTSGELRQHLEIDAHAGGVNDIAFAQPNKQLCIVTCGDDKTIKVWDAVAGRRLYMFEGHEAPVYSVCPHSKEQIQFIFSTAIDGKIKAWLYDCLGSRVDYDAPGLWCTTMAYSNDGTRLFSCGTSKEGEAHLVEWNESEGAIKREYSGFKKRSMGVVQFDTTKNRFLAAGDEFQIKFWDMDNNDMLTATGPNNGLPARPRLRFNKEGSLLAVSTSDNGFIILANNDGQRMVRMLESQAYEQARPHSDSVKPSIGGQLGPIPNVSSSMASGIDRDRMQTPLSIGNLANAESSKVVDVKPRIVDGADKTVTSWKLPDIVDSSHLKALRLPDPTTANKVMRLIYTNSGLSLLALASNAIHKLWKWQRSERNPSGKSTASIVPQLWQPANGGPMSNDVSENKPAEESAACIALSKNDSYVMSASGGKVSLFNMMTFKVMTTFMPPPPAATYLAFHPQDNNIIAIGMEDSTIQIYNVRVDEVKMKLKGHQKQITGLAFSQTLNALVSSGADAQLCIWNINGWEKRKSRSIQSPPGHPSSLIGETKVQFHNDQRHLLVVHESQIAIYDHQLECLKLWSPRESLSAAISSAIYSCDGLLLFTGFSDGAVGVFDADNLRLRCRIAPSAYISSSISSSNSTAYPAVIAAHPSDPNQFALGMSDGSVHVIEPTDADPKWGGPAPQENGGGSLPSNPSNSALNSQPSETPSR